MASIRIGRRVAAPSPALVPHTVMATFSLVFQGSRRLRAAHRRGSDDVFPEAMRAWGAEVVRRLRIRLLIEGLEHVDPDESYVVVSLHEGFIDVPVLTHLPLRLTFTARSELLQWRTLGRFLQATDQIVLADENPVAAARALLRSGAERLAGGESVVVFPQASILGIETAFQAGAARLARRSGARLLPVAIAGTHRVWEYPFSPLVRFDQPVLLRVLPPVEPDAGPGLEAQIKREALANRHAPVRRFDPDRDGWWDGYHYSIDPAFSDLADRHRARRREMAGSGG